MIANYRLYRNDRQTSNDQTRIFGGKCTYIKSRIEQELEKMDATIIEIQIGNHPPLKIISAYSRTGLIDGFPLVDLQKLLDSGSNVIIAADLNATNIAWNSPRSSLYSRKLFRYLQGKNGIRVLAPHSPTDINWNSWNTALDLAILKGIPFHYQIRVLNYLNSDHLPVILTLDTGSFPINSLEHFSITWENFRNILNYKTLPPSKLLAMMTQIILLVVSAKFLKRPSLWPLRKNLKIRQGSFL
ncbi:hypothetical protein AVEN_267866-1 [Araneus ventricosus]|uniref:Endonuclease/exonuclease/phosphatase domain-containing protein n=1 Tax=Araneus ventricosus TaxID=182803 RepID=A0A4Y2PMH0_ARAVE|nr:hypothetical protein AVEN_267866-1 [Araneus ventricosus]